ncbi:MAG TPA: filamentous hemagglutinin N-terminal domain-containing protein, partial [Terricaulis sp.]|nr:filamentous hemagglutinin N-terminal domain-containing protein [Terricaulis sp.]
MAAPAFGQVADLPQGGEVASGAASLNYSQPGALVVHQSTDSAIINWSSFDIGAANSVHFDQPGAESATLNRVLGDTPSVLAGALSAPGMVMLVNPNGVSLTESGVVDTGSFVASTLDIADSDFLSGRTTFRRNGRAGVVSNRGAIRVGEGGSVALIGAGVINEGVVEARLGAVAFGAGDLVTLDFAGDGFLSIGIPVSDLEGLTDASGRPLSALITADGAVRADGGRIFLSAAGAQSLMRQAINVPGELIARSVGRDAQGRIVLEAHGGAAVLSGRLDASGGAHDGGDVVINGGAVVQGGVINADGAAGGSVQIAA